MPTPFQSHQLAAFRAHQLAITPDALDLRRRLAATKEREACKRLAVATAGSNGWLNRGSASSASATK